MTSRHSEFHAAYLPQDSCDFDFDEIDRRLGWKEPGDDDIRDKEDVSLSALDEVRELRELIRVIVSDKNPVRMARKIHDTLCKDVR